MRKLLCFAILLPLLAFAGQRAARAWGPAPITGGEIGLNPGPAQSPSPRGVDLPDDVLGRMDTVGGTTYDMMFNGPPEQCIYFDPGYGIHVTWIQSADLGGSYPDRSMFYNFYDPTLSAWAFDQGADFMAWGVRLF